MTNRTAISAAARDAGAAVRRSGRCLTVDDLRRNHRLKDLIACAGWSRVWGSAVQGWADENRRLSAKGADNE